MSTSGTYVFNLTRDSIINAALRKIGVLDPEGQTASATQITNAAESLNTMVKAWQNIGLQIWTRKNIVIPLVPGKGQYLLSVVNNESLGTTIPPPTMFQANFVTEAYLGRTVGSTSMLVTNTTGFVAGMGVAIQLTAGYWFITTVASVSTINIFTLQNALPAAILAGAKFMVGPTAFGRPTRLLDAYLNQSNGSDMPIRIITKEEYNRFGVKTSTGTPVQIVYEPNLNYGILNTYPVMSGTVPATAQSGYTLFVEVQALFEDFTVTGDNPDFPQEWLQALVWGLAYELAIEYQMTETRLGIFEKRRDEWLSFAGDSSQEPSVLFQPDYYASSQYG